jgi:hypothetical protein
VADDQQHTGGCSTSGAHPVRFDNASQGKTGTAGREDRCRDSGHGGAGQRRLSDFEPVALATSTVRVLRANEHFGDSNRGSHLVRTRDRCGRGGSSPVRQTPVRACVMPSADEYRGSQRVARARTARPGVRPTWTTLGQAESARTRGVHPLRSGERRSLPRQARAASAYGCAEGAEKRVGPSELSLTEKFGERG